MKSKINVLVVGVPFHEGMAGTKRVRNLLLPLFKNNTINISNLILTNIFESKKIGEANTINNIDYSYVGYTSFKNILSVYKFYQQGFNFIRLHGSTGENNIAYFYGYPDLKNILFVLYARYKKYKVVFDIVEDNRLNNNFYGLAGKIRNFTSIRLLKLLPGFADAVIVISLHLEKWLNSIFRDKIKVYNIPITIDAQQYDKESTTPQKNKSDIINIFYGGSFAEKDGLEYLIEAFRDISKTHYNLQLILTGGGNGYYMEKLLALVKEQENIKYLGFLSTEEYYNTLHSADICCMTRNNSLFANAGFPFKLGEFLAAGKAVIATKVGDVPLYLFNGVNAILIEPESIIDIKNALLELIENKGDIRRVLGNAARQTAFEHFDGRKLSMKLSLVFDDILTG